ncbi:MULTISPECIES: bifunctional ornithine acetyltransferase/N-acetylglutamate synthase [unclassified Fusibacter]|uniref:bifunctional ornithine acetyltransferase/N-acetylglutamate synthase n=1 Tax=unclassified Fusibacter TaxID=2624464 RepID=UPI001011B390|nr:MULTISPECIES: bifunctional ornithine acetyltransferase/N-acetylglutamate synthase [unclassified Fusibacter]MCK8059506.1 bifunctional ornithine acetyltransferase/N-acetylglutamate synthase [Fusibacter sp. A2]NPE21030.1 bifunctional ornithine acetyltransferase/N-acetylglutamate synthase [Fusibacter sp. A1]RXV62304.1 bifunctional ornithine acetyltransferase/N-acetylglutamate synthase [Fusibacter sp. A1]
MKPKYDIIPVDGFEGAGLHSGVKRKKKDLGVIFAKDPCVASGVFTQNITKAAPVLLSEKHIRSKDGIHAIVVNSGNANALTGPQGAHDAQTMADEVSCAFEVPSESVLVASTGIIGVAMPMEKINFSIKRLPVELSHNMTDFGQSILTTDTFLKVASLMVEMDGVPVTFLGLAKGSGMIHPNMATMLGFILTDVPVEKAFMDQVLFEATDSTFNMISVDGDTSTNDMVLMLASEKAQIQTIDEQSGHAHVFKTAVHAVCESLAKQIAHDGEGATKMIEVKVEGAQNNADAKKAAKSVVSSSLVKAAFFGQDANWGRIACALGYSGAAFSPERFDLSITSKLGSVAMVVDGIAQEFDEKYAFNVLRGDVLNVLIDLKIGQATSKAWGCDLSYDYVKINGAYRS